MATTPSLLDPAARASIIGQAEALAKKSGRTREQELYSYAQGQGIDDAGIDTFMGFDQGTSANWAKANAGQGGIAMPNSQPATQQSGGIIGNIGANMNITGPNTQPTANTPVPQASVTTPNQWTNLTNSIQNAAAQAPRPVAGGAAAGGAAAGGTAAATPFTEAQKDWIIKEANKRAIARGTSVVAEIAAEATKNGRSLADVEIEMGYAPGTLTGGAGGGGGGAAGGGGATAGGTTPGGTNALGGAVVPGVTPGAKLTDPSTWTTTSDQTVAGQLTGLLNPNNPLMQQARTRALTQANSRGLLNSTIAETGADAAMNDIALQIAQADAAQGSKVAGYNVGAQNQFTMADKAQGFDLEKMSAEQKNVMERLAAQQGYNLETMSVTQANDLAKFAAQVEAQNKQAEQKFGYDKQLVEIQKASNLEIAGMESQYRQQIQASASATSIMNQLPTLIARVMENKDTDAAAKQAQINYHVATATAALKLAGQFAGDVDLSGALDGILGLTP